MIPHRSTLKQHLYHDNYIEGDAEYDNINFPWNFSTAQSVREVNGGREVKFELEMIGLNCSIPHFVSDFLSSTLEHTKLMFAITAEKHFEQLYD